MLTTLYHIFAADSTGTAQKGVPVQTISTIVNRNQGGVSPSKSLPQQRVNQSPRQTPVNRLQRLPQNQSQQTLPVSNHSQSSSEPHHMSCLGGNPSQAQRGRERSMANRGGRGRGLPVHSTRGGRVLTNSASITPKSGGPASQAVAAEENFSNAVSYFQLKLVYRFAAREWAFLKFCLQGMVNCDNIIICDLIWVNEMIHCHLLGK